MVSLANSYRSICGEACREVHPGGRRLKKKLRPKLLTYSGPHAGKCRNLLHVAVALLGQMWHDFATFVELYVFVLSGACRCVQVRARCVLGAR